MSMKSWQASVATCWSLGVAACSVDAVAGLGSADGDTGLLG